MEKNCTPAARITKSLLGYGIIAGPLYVGVSLAQALSRDGFDLSRHAWSLLENGRLGWIQIANFVVVGLMTVAAAVGLRRALAPGQGSDAARAVRGRAGTRAASWGPYLIAAYGVSLVGAGIFRADPAAGFPAGTAGTPAPSWHGTLHFVVGGTGFLCLVVACFVLAGRFRRDGQPGLAWFSRIAGVVFLAGFAGIASGSHGPTTLAFVAAVIVICAWLTTVSVRLYRTVG